jgi:hypothetical protein
MKLSVSKFPFNRYSTREKITAIAAAKKQIASMTGPEIGPDLVLL